MAAGHRRRARLGESGPDADESIRFVREAHSLVRDLVEPHQARYWADLAVTLTTVYAAFALSVTAISPALRTAAMIVCALAAYRAAVFTHEIAHRPPGSFTTFTIVWNVLCGIPFCMPSFLYGDHKGHHAKPAYGTPSDPEYLRLHSRSRMRVVVFLPLALVYPLLGPLRFLLLTPLALLASPLNRLIWTRASSLYNMNEGYRRPWDAHARSRSRWLQEIAACAWVWAVVALVITGRVAWTVIVTAYGVFALWMVVNQVRTLAAHRYENRTAMPLSLLDQVLDTNTFSHGRWLPHLWAPLGMRYHALHHLMPAMPYHAMGLAHRRLMDGLPSHSPYHATVRRNLWQAVTPMLRASPG